MPKISVVVRCYNEEKYIEQMLHGIREQTIEDVEIILVDSGSTDRTLTIADKYDVRHAYIAPEDFSFGRSLNLGCREARAPIIVIGSAHVYPIRKDWLEKLMQPFDDANVGLVYGCQRGHEVTKYSEHRIFQHWFPDQSDHDQAHPFCNNANSAIRRSLWEKQPYDETLTGLEDLAWAKAIKELGYKIAYAADAGIVHIHEEAPSQTYNRYRREAIALKTIYPDENFTFLDFLRHYTTNVFSDYYHALHDEVLLRNLADIPRFRLMQLWGTYRGFRHRGPVGASLKRKFYYASGFTRPRLEQAEKDSEHTINYAPLAPSERQ